MRKCLFLAAALAFLNLGRLQAAVVDSINESATPTPFTFWAATEVGWFYTPGFSYDLASIETLFGSGDGRTITVEVYDEHPGDGGVLLRSGSFISVGGVFEGGAFADLSLVSGEDYFVGFRNVGDLLVNVTSDGGAENLPGGLRFSFSNDGSYGLGPETGFTAQPILRFLSDDTAAVPEPMSMAIWGIGAIGLIGAKRLRRKIAK